MQYHTAVMHVSIRHVQVLGVMKQDHAIEVQTILWNGMSILIGDARPAESHVRNAASFSHRNGMVKESHIAVRHASIQLAMGVPRHGLGVGSTNTTVRSNGTARGARVAAKAPKASVRVPKVREPKKAMQMSDASDEDMHRV